MINFNFGNTPPNKKQIVILSIIISSSIALLSQCTKVSENGLWDVLDEIQRKYFPQTILNEMILKDPHKIDRRVKRDVDKAIFDIIPEYDRIIFDYNLKYQPKYVDEKNNESVCYTDGCKLLAPPMRICSPWVDSCPKE
jgi:hypothetical protein